MYQEDLVPSFRRQTFTLIQTTNSTWICPIRPEASSLNGDVEMLPRVSFIFEKWLPRSATHHESVSENLRATR